MIIVFVTIIYYIFEATSDKPKKENMVIFDSPKSKPPKLEIQTGYYNSNGVLKMTDDEYQDTFVLDKCNGCNKNNVNKNHTDVCRLPTCNNPMMNDTINDLQVELPPEACNVDDEDIQDKMTQCFNDKLFRDVSDVFERENSQRQFFTVPQMNPPDQTAFANWLYNTDNFCKTNPEFCPRYTDLRLNQGIISAQRSF